MTNVDQHDVANVLINIACSYEMMVGKKDMKQEGRHGLGLREQGAFAVAVRCV